MDDFKFELKDAVREAIPIIMGIVGATGSGKTGSALEVATGFQDVQGGDIGILETDGKRSLVYAGAPMFSEPNRIFKFKRAAMDEPFSPLHYKAGLDYLISQGVRHAIIDSTSHMHEGPGGTLDAHDKELDRLSKGDDSKREANNFRAWARPKTELTHFIQHFKRLNINLFFCFRAKEKMKIVRVEGKQRPVDAGWQPIANEELFYEMDLACMLLPNSDGQPIWNHDEHKPIKALPAHYREFFKGNPRLSAALGRQLATWAKGGQPAKTEAAASKPAQEAEKQAPKLGAVALGFKAKLLACRDEADFQAAREEFNVNKSSFSMPERTALIDVANEVKEALGIV